MAERVVLLIEDNPSDERLTLRALSKNNVMNEVVVACDGIEALDYLNGDGKYSGRSKDEVPALIVLDLNLPKLSGLEVLAKIRGQNHTQHVPVVVLTASEDASAISDAYARGANSFVKKPTDATEFMDAVLNVALYWLLLNETPRELVSR